ncbi:hypothetical protein ACF07T_39915 [Streptomyces sp. NPDC015184]|uniref:hypothetical protein n=1 Tax=Streptomyces sp. NPDC015184 TaxID=3364946 RepID=UPI0036FC70FA
MRRYLYRCPICRTTSPLTHTPAALAAERDHHRQALHAGHHPDGEKAGEVDRRGRWHADLDLVARLHTRLTDT